MTNLKRKDTLESRAHWEYCERVTREVEAEIDRQRERAITPEQEKRYRLEKHRVKERCRPRSRR
jgi:hypothetical protein